MAAPLDRELVVRTALRVLDEVGLDGLTLRRIATELDVRAPALYWHFANKQALLDEMATTMLRDRLAGDGADDGRPWPEFLAATARASRAMLLRYRDGAKVFSGTYLTDNSLYTGLETTLRRLTDAGLSLRDAVRAFGTLYSYTVGFVIEEQAADRDPRYELGERNSRVDPERFPLALAAGAEVFTGYDERFEAGVDLIVRGIVATASTAGPGADTLPQFPTPSE